MNAVGMPRSDLDRHLAVGPLAVSGWHTD